MVKEYKKATFAAGCFWGIEARFRDLKGVVDAQVGYTGGQQQDPTYKEVCTDTTGHAEAVELVFDPDRISYNDLLDAFWDMHDPTTLNRQGPDHGSQYRSAIYTHDDTQKELAEKSRAEQDASGRFANPIVTQIEPAQTFYRAEEYHQQYFAKTGRVGTCYLK